MVEQFKVNDDGRSHLGAESPILGAGYGQLALALYGKQFAT